MIKNRYDMFRQASKEFRKNLNYMTQIVDIDPELAVYADVDLLQDETFLKHVFKSADSDLINCLFAILDGTSGHHVISVDLFKTAMNNRRLNIYMPRFIENKRIDQDELAEKFEGLITECMEKDLAFYIHLNPNNQLKFLYKAEELLETYNYADKPQIEAMVENAREIQAKIEEETPLETAAETG